MSKTKVIAIDTETYPNYTCVACKSDTGTVWAADAYGVDAVFSSLDRKTLMRIIKKYHVLTFNGVRFDSVILNGIISRRTVGEIYNMAQDLIVNDLWYWEVERKYGMSRLNFKKHSDLWAISPAFGSLKLQGARLHSKILLDLPIGAEKSLTVRHAKAVKDYCVVDLDATLKVYEDLKDRIKLRTDMSKKYNMDFHPKSDAQIAESYTRKKLGVRYVEEVTEESEFRVPITKLAFRSDKINKLVEDINEMIFTTDKLKIQVPKPLVRVIDKRFKVAAGGLHSTEKNIAHRAEEGKRLIALDVTSYYPNIILNHGFAPASYGNLFLEMYKELVAVRQAAKVGGDKTTSESLKIVINGLFGKFASPWSVVYAPELLLSVTLYGQLYLLKLIEMLEAKGRHKVISANTDGIVIETTGAADALDRAYNWCRLYGFKVEVSEYSMYYGRDVNNYFAWDITEGKLKTKGVFSPPSIMKNPAGYAIYDAVINYFRSGKTIESHIHLARPEDFVLVRTVKGGCKFEGGYAGKPERGKFLGRVGRWYWSKTSENALQYVSNGNKVPDSSNSTPAMVLSKIDREDIDYDRYIAKAQEVIDNFNAT